MPPASPLNADARPLPVNWSEHFDPERRLWFYHNNAIDPPSRSYVHPLDILGAGSNNRGARSFAQQLYASARALPSPAQITTTDYPMVPAVTVVHESATPPSVREDTEADTASGTVANNEPSPVADSTAYTKQFERYAQLQAQSATTRPGASSSSPPVFISASPPLSPLDWEQAGSSGADRLERRPTLPLYSPVADEGLSYESPEDNTEALTDRLDSLSITSAEHQELTGRGFADSIAQHEREVDSPPAFSSDSVGAGAQLAPSRRPLPAITPAATATVMPTTTRRAVSALASSGSARRISGPRPGPGSPTVAAPAPAPPSPIPTAVPARPPSSVSSITSPSVSLTGTTIGPSTDHAAYARSLYASAVASAAHPMMPSQRPLRAASASASAVSGTGPGPGTGTGTGSGLGIGHAQSASASAIVPSQPASIPHIQVHVQPLRAQNVVQNLQTQAATTVARPPPLPHRRSASSPLLPQVAQVHAQIAGPVQVPVQTQMPMQSLQGQAQPQAQQSQAQARPYRYSTAVVPPPSSLAHSSSTTTTTTSSAPLSFFGTPAASSSAYGVSSSALKVKKKMNFFGVSQVKHKEQKRLEAERRDRERAAEERARIAQESGISAGVAAPTAVRRVPPPPNPMMFANRVNAQSPYVPVQAQSTGTNPTVAPSPPPKVQAQYNPYVTAAQAQIDGFQTHQTVQPASQPLNQFQLQRQRQNSTFAKILSEINASLSSANRPQPDVSASLATSVGNVVGSVANAAVGGPGGDSGGVSTVGLVGAAVLNELESGVDLSALGGGVDLSALAGGVDLSSLASGVDLSSLANGVDLSGLANGVDLSTLNLSASGIDLSGLNGVDLSSLTNGMGGVDLSSLTSGLGSGFADGSFGLDTSTDPSAYAFGLDGSATDANSGMYDPGAFDASQFGGADTYDPSTGMDSSYGGDPTDGSSAFDSDPSTFSYTSPSQDPGFDYGSTYPDYSDPQSDQNDQNDQQAQQDQLDQLNAPFDTYGQQMQNVCEQQEDAQQDQFEDMQHKLEEQEKLDHRLEQQAQHEQQMQQKMQQQQLEEQAKLEQQMQQQIQQQTHAQSQTQAQAQAQMQAQLEAQQQKIQQEVYAKVQAQMQAQMQAQAKLQAQYLAQFQAQQLKMQQQVQAHLQAQMQGQMQGQTTQTQAQATAALLASIKKMEQEQAQAMAQLAQMQLGGGVGGAAAGKPHTASTGPPAKPQASVNGSAASQGGTGPTVHMQHTSAGVHSHNTGSTGANQTHGVHASNVMPTTGATPNHPRPNAQLHATRGQQHLMTQAQQAQFLKLQQLQQLQLLQQSQQQTHPLQQPLQQQQQQYHQAQQQNQGTFSGGAQQELGRLAVHTGVRLGGMLLGSVLSPNNNYNYNSGQTGL